jgi:hypothetical protein
MPGPYDYPYKNHPNITAKQSVVANILVMIFSEIGK